MNESARGGPASENVTDTGHACWQVAHCWFVQCGSQVRHHRASAASPPRRRSRSAVSAIACRAASARLKPRRRAISSSAFNPSRPRRSDTGWGADAIASSVAQTALRLHTWLSGAFTAVAIPRSTSQSAKGAAQRSGTRPDRSSIFVLPPRFAPSVSCTQVWLVRTTGVHPVATDYRRSRSRGKGASRDVAPAWCASRLGLREL